MDRRFPLTVVLHYAGSISVYRVEESRGKGVVFDRLGVLFDGVLVSDCLAGYEIMPFRMPKSCADYFKAIAQAHDWPSSPASRHRQQARSEASTPGRSSALLPSHGTNKTRTRPKTSAPNCSYLLHPAQPIARQATMFHVKHRPETTMLRPLNYE